MKLKERLTPALLVSESFFPLLGDEVRLLDAVERAVDSGFYTRLEISTMKTRQGRQRLREIARRYGLQITQWITNDLNELQLNPLRGGESAAGEDHCKDAGSWQRWLPTAARTGWPLSAAEIRERRCVRRPPGD